MGIRKKIVFLKSFLTGFSNVVYIIYQKNFFRGFWGLLFRNSNGIKQNIAIINSNIAIFSFYEVLPPFSGSLSCFFGLQCRQSLCGSVSRSFASAVPSVALWLRQSLLGFALPLCWSVAPSVAPWLLRCRQSLCGSISRSSALRCRCVGLWLRQSLLGSVVPLRGSVAP